MTRFYMLLVGENSYVSQTNFVCLPDPHPFSASLLLAALPREVTARRRAEYPHFVRRFRLTATRALPSTRKGDAFCRSTPLALRATSPTGGDTPLTPD